MWPNQGIVAEINLAIGATGIVSNECKMVVQEYGDQIIEMLLEQVEMSADLHLGMELSDLDVWWNADGTCMSYRAVGIMLFLVSGLWLSTDIYPFELMGVQFALIHWWCAI